MTASTITYSLRRNGSCFMPAVSFGHGIDRAARQARVSLVRRYVR